MHLFSDQQRDAAAHAQPGNADLLIPGLQTAECLLGGVQPVLPVGLRHGLHTLGMAGEVDALHRKALGMKQLPQGAHMRRRAGKAMQQQHGMVAALQMEGLALGR